MMLTKVAINKIFIIIPSKSYITYTANRSVWINFSKKIKLDAIIILPVHIVKRSALGEPISTSYHETC